MSDQPLWGGRFAEGPADDAARLGRSLEFDIELLDVDLLASVAHVWALAGAGVIENAEAEQLEKALERVPQWLEDADLPDHLEDVHSLVEYAVTEQLGDLGAKLHAGRSRNDLVATDFRLWCLGASEAVAEQVDELIAALSLRARETADMVMPGFTHNRPAQVVTAGYVLAAHAFALLRDVERLDDGAARASFSPLGAGALATSTLGLDAAATAERLGLERGFDNALDAVADRDGAIEFASALTILGMHVSRLAADLARWSEPAFGYLRLADAYSTGSSMMPQKRNPDVLELARGKFARLLGNLTTLAALPAGLPLGYHRDLQDDKEPLFDSVFTVMRVLPAITGCLVTATFDGEDMRADAQAEDLYATDLAEALVKGGIAFRDAHRRIGELLKSLEADGRGLRSLTEAEWKELGLPDGASMLDPDVSVSARAMPGGPSLESVRAQADAIDAALEARRSP
jgi:argininosuccinate lyase